jgi:pimeloyl-ACP methyl ester carboxylesterase
MKVNSTTSTAIGKGIVVSKQVTTGQVTSADGTPIGYRQSGRGPGSIVMHGGVRASQHYLRLAEALADDYTIHIPDRRGRGLSGAPGTDYSIEKEIEDLEALMQKTGARQVFGHSAGGFFALEAVLKLPIKKLALYEPAVSINGSLPLDWLPAFEQALNRNDPVAAMAIFFKGLRLHWTSRLPVGVLAAFSRLMLRTADGREMAELLPTGLWEIKEFRRLERIGLTYKRYQNIPAETLLLGGSRSPDYLRAVLPVLAKEIARSRMVERPGLDHNAPDQNAPELVAIEIQKIFSELPV